MLKTAHVCSSGTVDVTERGYPVQDRQGARHAQRRLVHALADDALRALEEMRELCDEVMLTCCLLLRATSIQTKFSQDNVTEIGRNSEVKSWA